MSHAWYCAGTFSTASYVLVIMLQAKRIKTGRKCDLSMNCCSLRILATPEAIPACVHVARVLSPPPGCNHGGRRARQARGG